MINLFMMGGPLFMGILSLLLIGVLIVAVRAFSNANGNSFHLVRSLGLLALVMGVLGQLIGLYDAFKFIEMEGSVSPAMLAGGFKVSMITTLYGMVIYVISIVLWMILKSKKSAE